MTHRNCRDGLVNGHTGCPECMTKLWVRHPERSDRQLEAELIDRHDDARERDESRRR